MNRYASLCLLFLSSSIIFFFSACAGMPSESGGHTRAAQASAAEPAGVPAAADPDYDPSMNSLVHDGWSLSMPPGWRAAVDHSGQGSYLFRLSHDLVRISVQPIDFDFEIDRSRLNDYMEDQLSLIGEVSRNEEAEALSVSRDGSFAIWDVERDAGGLHRVILEENERGLFEWRISIAKKRQELYEEAVMRMFREAKLEDNREVSRRIQDSGFEFSSQGGLWRWCGDMDQGFLLESYVNESEAHTFLSVTSHKSLIEADYKTEEWLKVIQEKSSETRYLEYSFSGRPVKTRLWVQSENEKKKEALFFYGEADPVLFYLDMRNREGLDSDVNAFLEGESFTNLLKYSVKLPEAGL